MLSPPPYLLPPCLSLRGKNTFRRFSQRCGTPTKKKWCWRPLFPPFPLLPLLIELYTVRASKPRQHHYHQILTDKKKNKSKKNIHRCIYYFTPSLCHKRVLDKNCKEILTQPCNAQISKGCYNSTHYFQRSALCTPLYYEGFNETIKKKYDAKKITSLLALSTSQTPAEEEPPRQNQTRQIEHTPWRVFFSPPVRESIMNANASKWSSKPHIPQR